MITSLDHLVLTVQDLDATRRFYEGGLGMQWITFGGNRHALKFGHQKINLHHIDRTFEPKAAKPTPGSADLCFLTITDLETVALPHDRTRLPHPRRPPPPHRRRRPNNVPLLPRPGPELDRGLDQAVRNVPLATKGSHDLLDTR